MHVLTAEEYDLLVRYLSKQDCVTTRAFRQRAKRNEDHLSIADDSLLYDGLPFIKPGSSRIQEIIQAAHIKVGHGYWQKTYKEVCKSAWGITEADVHDFVSSCTDCQRMQKKPPALRRIHPIEVDGIWEHVEMDLIDLRSHEDANDGYKYILSMVDHFSRFALAIPLKSKDASTVAGEILRIIGQFGIPRKLHSDNGTEFINSTLTEELQRLQIEIVHGLPRHPTTQGSVERFNQTFETIFGKMFPSDGGGPKRWIDKIGDVMLAYNCRTHEVFGNLSPFDVFYGRTFHAAGMDCSLDDKLRQLSESRERILKEAQLRSAKVAQKRKDSSMRSTKRAAFGVGDEVLLSVEGSDSNAGAMIR